MIFRIGPSKAERRSGILDSGALKDAVQHFRRDGALIVDEIVDTRLVERARQAFLKKYADYVNGVRRDETLKVGDRRLMITVDLDSPFDDRQLFDNPWLTPILDEILGDRYVLDAFGVVCSLAGAQTQCPHRDGGILFPEVGVDRLLPSVAITVAIPLLEMNEVNGTTELWPGSHRDLSYDVPGGEGVKPIVPEGSCVLWDFRLLHGGTANRGREPRPLVYLTYSRPWFDDVLNYSDANPKQMPLVASTALMSSLSERDKRILTRARRR
jgi:hypothetical protein